MIRQYSGMKAEKMTSSNPLPAGGYVAIIKRAEVINYDWGQVLELSFDIAEGEHKDFFAKQYRSDTREDKKWKGKHRLTIPVEGTQYFESNQRTFNNFIFALEDSNKGYYFDWDETKIKDKIIGVLFRNKEWEWQGKSGWTTECGAITDAQSIKNGDFKPLADKPLKGSTASNNTSSSGFTEMPLLEDDDDLPF